MQKTARKFWFILVLGIAVPILAISYGNNRSLTLDESVTLIWSYRAFHQHFAYLFQEIHTPSYDLLLGSWLSATKFTLANAKLFSTLAAIFSVISLYFFTAKYLGVRIATIAAALLAFSPLHIYYSQYARVYAFYIAASIFSSFYYLSYLRSSSRKNASLYVIATYILVCSHVVGFTILAAQSIHFLIRKIRTKNFKGIKHWFFLQVIILALYSPVLWIVFHRFNLARDIPLIYFWVPKPHLKTLAEAFIFLSGHWMIAVVFFSTILAAQCRRKHQLQRDLPSGEILSYLLLWLFTPMTILFIYSYLHHPIFLARGFAPSAVPLILLVAISLAQLSKQSLAQGSIVVSLFFISCWVSYKNEFGEQEHWREASLSIRSTVSKNAKKGLIFISPGFAAMPLSFYLLPECFFSNNFEDCLTKNNVYAGDKFSDFSAYLRLGAPVLFIGYDVTQEKNAEIVSKFKSTSLLNFEGEDLNFSSLVISRFSSNMKP